MESKVQKYIVDYFSFLENVYKSYKNNLLECQKFIVKLFALMERQRRLNKANIVGSPLEHFDGLISKLVVNLTKDINKYVLEIQNYSSTMEKMHESLVRKMTNLETSCNQVNFNETSVLVHGSAFQPCLSDLIEFSLDGVAFSLGVCSQIKYVIYCITLNSDKCDNKQLLSESFKFEKDSELRVKEILLLTQFCNKNE